MPSAHGAGRSSALLNEAWSCHKHHCIYASVRCPYHHLRCLMRVLLSLGRTVQEMEPLRCPAPAVARPSGGGVDWQAQGYTSAGNAFGGSRRRRVRGSVCRAGSSGPRIVGMARARGLANSWLDVCRRSRVLLGGSAPPTNWMWWGPLHGFHGPVSGEGLGFQMVKPQGAVDD